MSSQTYWGLTKPGEINTAGEAECIAENGCREYRMYEPQEKATQKLC